MQADTAMQVDVRVLKKIYAALDRARKKRRTVTYGDCARTADRGEAQWVYKHLWLIGLYCLENGRACLNTMARRWDSKAGSGTLTTNGRPPADEMLAVCAPTFRPLRAPTRVEIEALWKKHVKKKHVKK